MELRILLQLIESGLIKSRRLIWVRHVARTEGRSTLKMLTGKHTGKRYLRRPKGRREDNIRKYIRKIGKRNRIYLAQDRDY